MKEQKFRIIDSVEFEDDGKKLKSLAFPYVQRKVWIVPSDWDKDQFEVKDNHVIVKCEPIKDFVLKSKNKNGGKLLMVIQPLMDGLIVQD